MFRFDEEVRGELRQNWRQLAVAFCCLLFGFAAPSFALPFIYSEVIGEFGWTREQATLLASAKYLTGTVAALIVGRFIDVIGVRVMLILSIASGALALVNFLWVSTLSEYYLTGVLLGFAGPGAFVAIKVLISRTFDASQGTAMGLAMLGSSIGAALVPLVITYLIGSFGWRYGIAAMSLGTWLVAIPIMFLPFFRVGFADGDTVFSKSRPAGEELVALKASRAAARANSRQALKKIAAMREFWLLAGAAMLVAIADQAFTQHQVLIFNDAGLSRETTALGISAMGVIGVVCRVIVGNILDSSSNKGAAALYVLISIGSLLALFLGNPLIFMAYIVVRAAGHTALLVDTMVLTKHAFGTKNYGTLIGIYTAIHYVGYAIGPWLMGRLHDMDGSYRSAFALFAVIPVIAAAMVWMMKVELRPLRKAKVPPSPLS